MGMIGHLVEGCQNPNHGASQSSYCVNIEQCRPFLITLTYMRLAGTIGSEQIYSCSAERSFEPSRFNQPQYSNAAANLANFLLLSGKQELHATPLVMTQRTSTSSKV
eukprot:5344995-Pleurochrysis_carterae.AAC.2